jgi:hypothetical protein
LSKRWKRHAESVCENLADTAQITARLARSRSKIAEQQQQATAIKAQCDAVRVEMEKVYDLYIAGGIGVEQFKELNAPLHERLGQLSMCFRSWKVKPPRSKSANSPSKPSLSKPLPFRSLADSRRARQTTARHDHLFGNHRSRQRPGGPGRNRLQPSRTPKKSRSPDSDRG